MSKTIHYKPNAPEQSHILRPNGIKALLMASLLIIGTPLAYGQETPPPPPPVVPPNQPNNHVQNSSIYAPIQGDELRSVFTDTTIFSEYRRYKGMHNKSFDFTEHHNANGTTDYTELGSPTEQGLWNIVGDHKICYRYPASKRPKQIHCFFIFKKEKCYYNFAMGTMGPRIKDDAIYYQPRSWEQWVSRFVRKGDGGSCGNDVG